MEFFFKTFTLKTLRRDLQHLETEKRETEFMPRKTEKEEKKKKRRNKTGQQEINVDFKYFLTENLVGGNVTGLLECCENGIFIKPTEVSFNY